MRYPENHSPPAVPNEAITTMPNVTPIATHAIVSMAAPAQAWARAVCD